MTFPWRKPSRITRNHVILVGLPPLEEVKVSLEVIDEVIKEVLLGEMKTIRTAFRGRIFLS